MIELTELANINYPRRTRVYNTQVPLFFNSAFSSVFQFCFFVFQICILNSKSLFRLFCVLRINVFQFRLFCALHSKSLFFFFKYVFFKSCSSSFGSGSSVIQIFIYFSSLRNSSSSWINYSISVLELKSLRLDFITELEFQRLKMLVS